MERKQMFLISKEVAEKIYFKDCLSVFIVEKNSDIKQAKELSPADNINFNNYSIELYDFYHKATVIVNYKYVVKESDIPSDIEEYYEHDDIMFYECDGIFDKAMIERKFFDYGIIRRSHRVITDLFKETPIEEVKKSLMSN